MIPASRRVYSSNMDLVDRERVVDRYFITGIDIDPEINLIEGYVSLWGNGHQEIMVRSFYCKDSDSIHYKIIEAPTIKELDDILFNLNNDQIESFMSYLGANKRGYQKNLYTNAGRCVIANDLSSYFGYLLPMDKDTTKRAANFVDLLREIEKILGGGYNWKHLN